MQLYVQDLPSLQFSSTAAFRHAFRSVDDPENSDVDLFAKLHRKRSCDAFCNERLRDVNLQQNGKGVKQSTGRG